MRTAIHRFKYLGEYQRGHDLGRRLAERASSILSTSDRIDVVVPVPLHRRRFRQRGFNQATILAEAVAESLNVPLVHGVQRTRNTRSQIELDHLSRAANVAGAFDPLHDAARRLAGRRALIIDDVTTTGSTMAAVATALEAAGASSIIGLALAREG